MGEGIRRGGRWAGGGRQKCCEEGGQEIFGVWAKAIVTLIVMAALSDSWFHVGVLV